MAPGKDPNDLEQRKQRSSWQFSGWPLFRGAGWWYGGGGLDGGFLASSLAGLWWPNKHNDKLKFERVIVEGYAEHSVGKRFGFAGCEHCCVPRVDGSIYKGGGKLQHSGAMLVSLFSSPFVSLAAVLDLPKATSLVIVRLVLGSLLLTTFFLLRSQIHKIFGGQVALVYTLVMVSQFHLLFYVTRPLPNVFALAFVNLAYACWLAGRRQMALICLVFAAAVFRCDVILLLGPVAFSFLWRREIEVRSSVKWCSIILTLSVGLTIAIDSVMWKRWLWPEGEVFWFNSVLNRSSEWGVSPVHWYFTSALPRAMLAAYPLCFVSPLLVLLMMLFLVQVLACLKWQLGLILDRRMAQYVLPILAFVLLYSKLAHKELRFILFALPVLNLSAASAVTRIYNNRKKPLWGLMFLGCALMLLASLSIVGLLSAASYANYPGGKALAILHEKGNYIGMLRTVHVDVLPAMTGVSRFCEQEAPWSYSKKEGLSEKDLQRHNFTYLLSARSNIDGYSCLMAVKGFSKVKVEFVPPRVSLAMVPFVFIHGEHQSNATIMSNWPGLWETLDS
ncbi:hypothetical protein GOP47_0004197 [Adiantum capillus-veneris]|uniref:Mannosyltransferase n=1 Tax=Adiantum capillus-veneris TaxID=13818 RepID=A0A9D4V749_ADICA|nr:hypothetical protein GOP47_0004197 [Adiantum capillus-veneris]